ncbi:hypothetical protein TNCV_884361 [Trichonephila clavipes]|nr:hypothetical protein TNCV_884361 [Trichonephila clavipes]
MSLRSHATPSVARIPPPMRYVRVSFHVPFELIRLHIDRTHRIEPPHIHTQQEITWNSTETACLPFFPLRMTLENNVFVSVPSGTAAQGGPWPSQESFFQTSLLPANVFQFLVLKTRKSFSRPSIQPRFGLPFLRMPIG